jgi:MFS family permease
VTEGLTSRGVPRDPNLRVLALSTFVNRAGTGMVTTTFAVYFTREVGLAPTEVGLALSVAAIAGMLGQIPLGHLGDVRGPRETTRMLLVASGVALLGLLAVRSAVGLTAVLAVATTLNLGASAVRNGYVARIATGGRGVAFKAYLRAVTNVAMGFGAATGGLTLWLDQTWAYLTVLAIDGVSSIAAGLLTSRLPHLPPGPARAAGEPRLAVLHDHPFVLVTVLSGLVAMHFVVMDVGLALWVIVHTAAPTWVIAAVLIFNTASVALFQVRLSRGSDDVTSSARHMLLGACWIAGGFAVIAVSGGASRWLAVALLLAGAAVHVVGEMVSSGGQWGVSMGLAPMERQGQYQGFASFGFSLSNVIAPTLITLLCIEWGWPGWFVMGGIVVVAAAGMVPATRWALATRERYGAASATG